MEYGLLGGFGGHFVIDRIKGRIRKERERKREATEEEKRG